MEFDWDELKNVSNNEKHKISFERAGKLFEDSRKLVFESVRIEFEEKRYIAVGKIFDVLYTAVYTKRNNKIRIISAPIS